MSHDEIKVIIPFAVPFICAFLSAALLMTGTNPCSTRCTTICWALIAGPLYLIDQTRVELDPTYHLRDRQVVSLLDQLPSFYQVRKRPHTIKENVPQ
jgi:hypothetical protein